MNKRRRVVDLEGFVVDPAKPREITKRVRVVVLGKEKRLVVKEEKPAGFFKRLFGVK